MKATDLQSQSDRLHIQKKKAGEQERRKTKNTDQPTPLAAYVPTEGDALARFAPILSTRQERRRICCRSPPLQSAHCCCCCGHLRELALSSDKTFTLPDDNRDILSNRRHPHPTLQRHITAPAVSNGLPRVRETQNIEKERERRSRGDKFPTKQPRRFSSQTPTDRSRPEHLFRGLSVQTVPQTFRSHGCEGHHRLCPAVSRVCRRQRANRGFY